MSLPTRHVLTEAKVFAMRRRALDLEVRATTGPLRGWRRKQKRARRLTTRWIMMWMKLKRIDPREKALPGVMATRSACWDLSEAP